jgi:hypothetical protein
MKVDINSCYVIDKNHYVFCGDICDPRFVSDVLSPSLPPYFDHIFIDPHWGTVTLRVVYDELGLPQPSYPDYLSSLFVLCALHSISSSTIAVTALPRAPGLVFNELFKLGFTQSWRVLVPYGIGDFECYLAVGAFKDGSPSSIPNNFSDCQDWQSVIKRVFVNALGVGRTFFDPSAGRLQRFELAVKIGATAYAVELSPKLLADGLKRLSERGHGIRRL